MAPPGRMRSRTATVQRRCCVLPSHVMSPVLPVVMARPLLGPHVAVRCVVTEVD